METITKKLKLIYLPFLMTAISFIVLYTFLNWLLFIKLNIFSIKENIVNFWLPLALALISVLLWLRPRIKLLKLSEKKSLFYYILAVSAIAIPAMIAQDYIEKASGELTKLNNINEIKNSEPTKYYTLKSYYIDKWNIGVHTSFDISGRYNEDFNMHFYVVLPILRSKADLRRPNRLAWLGIEYSKRISNRLDEGEKEKQYQAFAKESQKDFDQKDFGHFVYLDRVGNTDAGEGFKEAQKNSPIYNPYYTSIFLPVNQPFENRTGNGFAWIFGAFAIAGGIWLVMLLLAGFDENELKRFESGDTSNNNELKKYLDFIKPKEGFFITPIIIYLNILVFIGMVLAGLGFIFFEAEDLLNWGANFRPLTASGQWWRLLTSTFVHGGFFHLFANMYGLTFAGIFLEPVLGRTRYLTAYLLTGISASCASLLWHDASVSIGASGAIFGLYGLFLVLILTKIFPPKPGKAFLTSTLVFIGFNLLMGFIGGGTDNAAHIGGLLSGVVFGLTLFPTLEEEMDNE